MAAEGQQISSIGRDGFETLLTGVATQLLGTPLEAFDLCINDALSRLVEFAGVERSTLSLVDPADGMVHTTHAVATPGVTPVPLGTAAELRLPWITKQVRENRVPVILEGEHDFPRESA